MCPRCGSPSVDFSGLAGGAASCRGCKWNGVVEELLSVPGGSAFSDEATLTSILNDMRQLLSGQLGLPYLKFLMKWGFLNGDQNNPAGTVDRKLYARYITAIGRAILGAVFEERARQEALSVAERVGPN